MEAGKCAGRKLTPLHPTKGAAVIFSSGWENMHQVDKLTSGTRFAVPCFFTTEPVPESAMRRQVATNDDIADGLRTSSWAVCPRTRCRAPAASRRS